MFSNEEDDSEMDDEMQAFKAKQRIQNEEAAQAANKISTNTNNNTVSVPGPYRQNKAL